LKNRTRILAGTGGAIIIASTVALLLVKYHVANTHSWGPRPWWAGYELRAAYIFLLFVGGPAAILFSFVDWLIYSRKYK